MNRINKQLFLFIRSTSKQFTTTNGASNCNCILMKKTQLFFYNIFNRNPRLLASNYRDKKYTCVIVNIAERRMKKTLAELTQLFM